MTKTDGVSCLVFIYTMFYCSSDECASLSLCDDYVPGQSGPLFVGVEGDGVIVGQVRSPGGEHVTLDLGPEGGLPGDDLAGERHPVVPHQRVV